MTMGAIKRVSLSEQVLASIFDYIQDHGMQIGEKLPTESEFSELFKVSRTSVREAMKALSMNGAVEAIPGKGTFIRQPMLNYIINNSENLVFKARVSISQIMEVRLAIELLSAELAIDRATAEDIKRVEEAMDDLRQAVLSQKQWAVQGAVFHVRIAESAKNPLIIKLVAAYSDTVGRYRDAMVDSNTEMDMERHIHEHEVILNALRCRDKDAMKEAIYTHMKNTEENLKRLVDQNTAINFINN